MINEGYEIERKFLIRFPSDAFLDSCSICYDIEQVYLKDDESGFSSRIRKREHDGLPEFFHTRKMRISDIRRVELENTISEKEYLRLMNDRDPERQIIYKKRYCCESSGKTFEIDVFPFWTDRAVMEIELSDEDEQFTIPNELQIIKEITDDRRYTNSSMAREIPQDTIQES